MIVKNAEATLARCLESVLPLTDQIVIGDTGSTDATVNIARRYGARVIDVTWEGDFAKARNRVLAAGRCDWALVMDGDEMLDHEARLLIPPLLEIKEIFGYAVCHWNYVRELHGRAGANAALPNPARVEESRGYPAYLTSINTRLFRRSPDIYFEHPVHETVAERLESLGRKTPLAPFVIHHFGYVEDSKSVREGKNELYHKLGQRKLRANPSDAHACFELGKSELEHRHDASAALGLFERACELNPSRAEFWIFAGSACCALGNRRRPWFGSSTRELWDLRALCSMRQWEMRSITAESSARPVRSMNVAAEFRRWWRVSTGRLRCGWAKSCAGWSGCGWRWRQLQSMPGYTTSWRRERGWPGIGRWRSRRLECDSR
jgi:glycosyltransferase involved in cell wall biosynthesis